MMWRCLFISMLACTSVLGESLEPIRLEQGLLQGHLYSNTRRYLGIPYAAPPVGALRWKAPQAPGRWEGVRRADQYGKPCAQVGNLYTSNDPATYGLAYGAEDCLYLNIWVPEAGNTVGARPVLVFLHGGAGIYGSASQPAYESSKLAPLVDAVVVTLNYRLGLLGHLHLPGRDDGAYGLQDQLAALHWVQENISRFGGDSGNVTLMGHSFGALSLWLHMHSESTRGLFHKAVSLSGVPYARERRLLQKQDEKKLLRIGVEGDSDDGTLAAMRGMAAARFIGARGEGGLYEAFPVHLPSVCDEDTCPLLNAVPTLIGVTGNEAGWLTYTQRSDFDSRTFWGLAQQVDVQPSSLAGSFSRWWSGLRNAVYNCLVSRAVDDISGRLAAEGLGVARLRFTWSDYPEPWRQMFGAFHGLDIPFVFGNFPDDQQSYDHFVWRPETRSARVQIHHYLGERLKEFIHGGVYAMQGWPDWNTQHYIKTINTQTPE